MKRVYFVDEALRDPVLNYDEALGLGYYALEVSRIILPSSSKLLLQHYSAFSVFLDKLSDEVILQSLPYSPVVTTATTATTTTTTTSTTTTTTTTQERVREWYEFASSEEEPTDDIMQEEMVTVNEQPPQHHPVDIVSLCGTAWEWHNDVIHRKSEQFTSFYAYSYMLAWVSFCRLFYLSVLNDAAKYTRYSMTRLDSHAYPLSMQYISCIVLTDSVLDRYTISETWETLGHLVPTLYYTQYTPTMKEYTYMLLFRYATFIARYFTDPDDECLFADDPSFTQYHEALGVVTLDEDEEGFGEDDADDDMMFETFDEYKNMTTEVHPNYSLKSRYLLEGELLLYSQLMRLNLSGRFQAFAPIKLPYNQHASNYSGILDLCLLACCKTNTAIVSNKVLRHETNEQFKGSMAHIHLYHGQKELFTRLWPGSGNEPGDVIAKFRPNDNLKIAETRRLAVPELCHSYQVEMQAVVKNLKETMEANNQRECRLFPFNYVEYEREMVMLTKICTIEWLNYGGLGSTIELKKAFLIEETCELREIDQILVAHRMRQLRKTVKQPVVQPYLVKLMQIYYVVDINESEIRGYATHFFVEAYYVWLAICLKYKLIRPSLFHEESCPIIKTILRFL